MIERIVIVCALLVTAGCTTNEPKSHPTRKPPETEQAPLNTAVSAPEPAQTPEAPAETAREPVLPDGPSAPLQVRTPDPPREPNSPKPVGTIDVTDQVRIIEPSASEANEPVQEAPEVAEGASPNPVNMEPAPPTEPKETLDEPGVLTSFYDQYEELLKEYVKPSGLVDYAPLRRKRLSLKHLLAIPDALDPNDYKTWSKNDQLAFWINTYNLKMLDVIARNYPIESSMWLRLTWPPDDIRHIKGIWSDYRFIVMDEEFTLGDVERRIFRRTFGDPRVYLALTYATQSSPHLRREPYRGKDLDRQLDDQVRSFLAKEQAFKIDPQEGIVYLSALFKPTWRGKEFVLRYGTDRKFKRYDPETRAVLNFLTRYLSPEDVYFLEVENYTLKYVNFSWCLNGTARGY